MARIIAINNNTHKNIKVKSNRHYIQSKSSHFAPLVIQEFVAASQEFPIVFVKDAQTGQFNSIALLGLKPGENLFFDENSWGAAYIPQSLLLYPFSIHQNPNSDMAMLCFDESSSLVNETTGDAFFDDKGNQNRWLSDKGEEVVAYIEKSNITQKFINLLLEYNLLIPQTLSLNLAKEEEYTLNGLYVIDEKSFNQLPEESFNTLRKMGVLPAIFASIMSLQRIDYLVRKKLVK